MCDAEQLSYFFTYVAVIPPVNSLEFSGFLCPLCPMSVPKLELSVLPSEEELFLDGPDAPEFLPVHEPALLPLQPLGETLVSQKQ